MVQSDQSPNVEVWCGYSAPGLGRCTCGDAANHQPGGRFYMPGRLSDAEGGHMTEAEALHAVVEGLADHLADLDREPQENASRCPACGEYPDYCRGHGDFDDSYGRHVLDLHDRGDHSKCVINCEGES